MPETAPSPAPRPRIVLASASPRRRELLATIGLPFEVRPAAIDESPLPAEEPRAHVARIALAKAAAVGAAGEWVLAADTVVVIDGEVLGKPRDRDHARQMLGRLQGREHRVLTGVALRAVGAATAAAPRAATHPIEVFERDGDRVAAAIDETAVRMRSLEVAEIAWYAGTGEPDDKAGAYALQGIGGVFVESVAGSSSNVIGLPLHLVRALFRALGLDLLALVDPAAALVAAGGAR